MDAQHRIPDHPQPDSAAVPAAALVLSLTGRPIDPAQVTRHDGTQQRRRAIELVRS